MMRRDYGSPLRAYRAPDGRYFILPPRSWRAQRAYATRQREGYGMAWRAVVVKPGGTTGECRVTAGPHLGQRVAWSELPEEVQRAVWGSFLGEYCPR